MKRPIRRGRGESIPATGDETTGPDGVQRQAQRTLHGSDRPRPALGFLTEGNQLEAGECCCRRLGEHPEMRDARCERGMEVGH